MGRRRDMTVFLDLLRMIGVSRWASMRALRLYPTNQRYRQQLLKEMVDGGLALVKPMKHARRMRLTMEGAQRVLRSNPIRYGALPDSVIGRGEYPEPWVRRLSLAGEAYYMSEFADYACHRDDKPGTDALLVQRCARDGLQNHTGNLSSHSYHSEEERLAAHMELDTAVYKKRVTPIGCLYTLEELRGLAGRVAMKGGGTVQDLDMLKHCRLTGFLFSAEGGWRLYSTEHGTPILRLSGEKAMEVWLREWCGNVYGTSLQENVYYSGNYLRGSLLLGDKSHRAAVSVLSHTDPLLLGSPAQKKKLADGEGDIPRDILTTKNLDHVYFLPVVREALPLFGCMRYQRWEEYMRKTGRSISLVRGDVTPMRKGIYDGALPGNRMFACIVPMNLSRIYMMVRDITHGISGLHLQCMEWQQPFIDGLKARLPIEIADTITVEHLTQEFLNLGYVNLREKYD